MRILSAAGGTVTPEAVLSAGLLQLLPPASQTVDAVMALVLSAAGANGLIATLIQENAVLPTAKTISRHGATA